MTVAHGDLPRAHGLGVLAPFDGVTLVPDRRDDGTNVLRLPAGSDFRFAYGPGSFRAHRAEATRLGLPVRVLRHPDLAYDVDWPADVMELGRTVLTGPRTRSRGPEGPRSRAFPKERRRLAPTCRLAADARRAAFFAGARFLAALRAGARLAAFFAGARFLAALRAGARFAAFFAGALFLAALRAGARFLVALRFDASPPSSQEPASWWPCEPEPALPPSSQEPASSRPSVPEPASRTSVPELA